jgi:phosphoribosyl-AMP cyclohydrolase
VEAPVTQQWLGQIALGLAWNKITPHFKMTWKGELAHFVSRRHAVWVKGTTVGAGALAKIGVISLTHNFDRSDPMMAWTEVRGRRLS